MNEVRVNRKAAGRVASGHPWIFSSDITDRGGAQPGEAVQVADPRGRPLGTAHYSSASQIALRMLSSRSRTDRPRFLPAAPARRRAAPARVVRHTDAYRVVHGEADLLPALVVDRYGEYLVMQTLDQGMDAAKATIASVPGGDFPSAGHRGAQRCRGADEGAVAAGIAGAGGRSAGAGFDHDERAQAGGRSAARAEDRRSFWISARIIAPRPATRTGAARSIASPRPAGSRCIWRRSARAWKRWTARLRRSRPPDANAVRQPIANMDFREADVFELLAGLSSARRAFAMVVLDPPAFAKSRQNLEAAARRI